MSELFNKSVISDSLRCDFCFQGNVKTVGVYDKVILNAFTNKALLFRVLSERQFPYKNICVSCIEEGLEVKVKERK